jgi:hypothetical protein
MDGRSVSLGDLVDVDGDLVQGVEERMPCSVERVALAKVSRAAACSRAAAASGSAATMAASRRVSNRVQDTLPSADGAIRAATRAASSGVRLRVLRAT